MSMSVPTANQSSNQLGRPPGASRGDWRRRLLLHHVPLAFASAVLFALFMALAQSGPLAQMDMAGESMFPQQAAPMDHGAGQTPNMAGTAQSGNLFGRGSMARYTTATGYVATVLLGLTLLLGPANLLLRRRNPVSSYLRRDVGAWTAIASVIHGAIVKTCG